MTVALGVVLLVLVAAFAGYTASYECLLLERRREGRSSSGRSACACGAPIPMYRNIPVLTWVLQRGRAACCDAPIPARYLVSEVTLVVAALLGAVVMPGHRLLGMVLGVLGGVVVVWAAHLWWLYDRNQ